MTERIPEGWYADPQARAEGDERWWNGHQWTAHTRRVDPGPDAPPAATAPGAQQTGSSGAGSADFLAQLRAKPKALADGTPLAEPSERIGAYVIDVLLVVVAARIVSSVVELSLGLGAVLGVPDLSWLVLATGLDVLTIAALWVGYQLLQGRSGTTIGKRLLRLRARPLDADGPLTTGQVLRRSVLGGGGVLAAMFPGAQLLGVLLVGFDGYRMSSDEWGRPWHDQVAGTVVVKSPR